MTSRSRRGRVRHAAAGLCLVLLVCCASPTPVAPTPSAGLPQPSGNNPPPSGSTDPSILPGPTGQPLDGDPLPADIVSDIDAIVGAASMEDAIAATRVVLERSGVVVTDDPASAPRSVAGIYIGTDQLATMAQEARSRAGITHVTFAQFAETFAALALLPPNDGLLDLLSEPVASPNPATDSFALDLDGQPLLLADLVTEWVNRSLVEYPSDDPLMTALTASALYLAELAARQYEPVDLRESFMPSRLQLGALDITLLVAGLRTSLVLGAAASGLGPNALAQAGEWDVPPRLFEQADPTACGEITRRLNAGVPVLPDVGTFVAGEAIKGFAEATVRDMFKNGGGISKAVGPAFEALGVLFRVHALWLLYQHTEVTLEIEPPTIHKPIGLNAPAAAMLVAGISDAEWEKAVNDRDSSPLAANLKACARLLGIPVPSDLVDIGEATSTWRASWTIAEGGAHAQFEGCQFIPSCDRNATAAGRLERGLAKRNDHSGEDTVIIEIKPEKETDHPGDEVIAPVRVCAHVRTDKPPDIGTLLNGATAGRSGSFGVGGIASLASSIANILLSWWQFVATIDACAWTAVTFHVPQPGNWRGTITANSEFHESTTTRSGPQTYSHTRSADITDTFYVAGDDGGHDGSGLGIPLAARQYTRGGEVVRDIDNLDFTNASGCSYLSETVIEASGGWSFDGEGQVSVVLQPSGAYQLTLSTVGPEDEIILPGTWTKTIVDNGSTYECEGFGTFTNDNPMAPNGLTAVGGLLIEGQLDPAAPGSVLKGSVTFRDPNDPRYVQTISWELTRDTPIVLPVQRPG